jgi:hypothetical protein
MSVNILKYLWFYLLACLLTTVIATIATAPFTLFHFGRVPVWSSLVTNMVAVPVSSLLTLPAGMLAIFLMPFGLEGPMIWLVEQSLKLMMAVANETAGWRCITGRCFPAVGVGTVRFWRALDMYLAWLAALAGDTACSCSRRMCPANTACRDTDCRQW